MKFQELTVEQQEAARVAFVCGVYPDAQTVAERTGTTLASVRTVMARDAWGVSRQEFRAETRANAQSQAQEMLGATILDIVDGYRSLARLARDRAAESADAADDSKFEAQLGRLDALAKSMHSLMSMTGDRDSGANSDAPLAGRPVGLTGPGAQIVHQAVTSVLTAWSSEQQRTQSGGMVVDASRSPG